MYLYRAPSKHFFVVLEIIGSNLGFPVSESVSKEEAINSMQAIGQRINDDQIMKSIDPSLTLRISRFKSLPPEDEETNELRIEIDGGVEVSLVTYNNNSYFDKASEEMISLHQ